MPSYIYGGVTPKFLFDTRALQDTPKLVPVKGRLVENTNGVCMALTADWLLHWSRNNPVTESSQLKQGLALSLAQTAYWRNSHGGAANDRGFLESSGLKAGKRRFYFKTKESTSDRHIASGTAVRLIGITGPVLVSTDDHVMGFYQKHGVIQFFDANEGCFEFSSPNDFAVWFKAYMAADYPGTLDMIGYLKVS